MIVVAIVGLLVFGGDLPKMMKDFGQMWVKMRRSINDFKREAGLDDAVDEIRRATDFRLEEPRWRRDMDHAAGPARLDPAVDTPVVTTEPPPAATESAAASAATAAAPAADTEATPGGETPQDKAS